MHLNAVNTREIKSEAALRSENNEKHTINIESSDANLIDLLNDTNITQPKSHENYKNKQIADYQLKMLEEFCRTSTLTRKYNDLQETEFRSFFDKYENNKKTDEFALSNEDLLMFEQNNEWNQKRLASNSCAIGSNRFSEPHEPEIEKEEINTNYEDLIEEVMFEQHLEKQQLVSVTLGNPNVMETAFNGVDIPRTPNTFIDSKEPEEDFSNIFDEIITKNKMKYFKTPGSKNPSPAKYTSPPLMISDDGKANTNQTKTKLEQKALNEELVTKYDVKYLEAVKRIEKTFQKRSVLKSGAEKVKLTPGPSFYEKTVVLPQIMQRLKHMEDKSDACVKMKLILDEGPSCAMSPHNIQSCMKNPINTLCVRHVQQDKSSINPSLIDGPSCSTLLNHQNKKKMDFLTPISKSQSIQSTMEIPISNKEGTLKKPVCVNSIDEIPVLRPPEILLKDCNKERLIAYETGKLFSNFVRDGRFYTP